MNARLATVRSRPLRWGANLPSQLAKSRRIWVLAAAPLVLAGLGFAALPGPESSVEGPPRSRPLAVRTVAVQPVSAYQAARAYTGTIVARRTSQLGFELPGKLTQLDVDEGDVVTTGMRLGQLDTEHLEIRRRQTKAPVGRLRDPLERRR